MPDPLGDRPVCLTQRPAQVIGDAQIVERVNVASDAERHRTHLGAADEIRRQKDAGQVGMTFEDASEHVPDLALAPIRIGIHTHHSRDLGVVSVHRDSDLQRQIVGERCQLIEDVIARRFLRPVIHRIHG